MTTQQPKKTAPPAEQPPAEPKTDEPDKPARVTTEDTAPLRGVATDRPGQTRPRRIIVSEGVKHDLARLGKVVDPGTGYELRRAGDGKVTAHDRATGKRVDIPIV